VTIARPGGGVSYEEEQAVKKLSKRSKPVTPAAEPVDTKRCTAVTRSGQRCRLGPGPLCAIHAKPGKPTAAA